jgi:predicted MPP superfamily phosphohydrolase
MSAMTRRMFLIGGASTFSYLYLVRLSITVRRYRVPIRALPLAFEGFTILQLSDLHDKDFGSAEKDLVNLFRQENFDMVALTGDLVARDRLQLTPALELISGIQAISGRPVYSVSGNHDWYQERGAQFNSRLREVGVRVLSNSSAPIERGKDRIWIIGVDDPVTLRDRLDQAIRGTDNSTSRLLLAHSPQIFPKAVANGLDLVLAGHTHGGQIRIPFLGAPFVPSMGHFPRWDYGLYSSGATTMIVSGGLGESWFPIRFNIRPEVSLVTLERCLTRA